MLDQLRQHLSDLSILERHPMTLDIRHQFLPPSPPQVSAHLIGGSTCDPLVVRTMLVRALSESLADVRRDLVGAFGHLLAQRAVAPPLRAFDNRINCIRRGVRTLINLQIVEASDNHAGADSKSRSAYTND